MKYSAVQPTPLYPESPQEPRYLFIGHLYGDSNFERRRTAGDFLTKIFHAIVGLVTGGDTAKQLSRPQSGWVDETTGRILVTDSGRKNIFVFDEFKGEFSIWEDAGLGRGFKTPVGIAGVGSTEIWVADADLQKVIRLNTQGEYVSELAETFQRPTGIAYDSATQRVYIADAAAHKIKYFDRNGQKIGEFGGHGDGPGQFNSPTHLAFGADELIVSDTLNARVQVFSRDGKYLRQFGKRGVYLGDIPRPKGVAMDHEGRVYVVESYYDYLLVYDRYGKPLIPIGGENHRDVAFDLPAGVWLDAYNRVYVADMLNSRVAVFQYVGQGGEVATKATQNQ